MKEVNDQSSRYVGIISLVILTLISFSLLALLVVGSNFSREAILVAVQLVVASILFGLVSGYIVFRGEEESAQSQSTPD